MLDPNETIERPDYYEISQRRGRADTSVDLDPAGTAAREAYAEFKRTFASAIGIKDMQRMMGSGIKTAAEYFLNSKPGSETFGFVTVSLRIQAASLRETRLKMRRCDISEAQDRGFSQNPALVTSACVIAESQGTFKLMLRILRATMYVNAGANVNDMVAGKPPLETPAYRAAVEKALEQGLHKVAMAYIGLPNQQVPAMRLLLTMLECDSTRRDVQKGIMEFCATDEGMGVIPGLHKMLVDALAAVPVLRDKRRAAAERKGADEIRSSRESDAGSVKSKKSGASAPGSVAGDGDAADDDAEDGGGDEAAALTGGVSQIELLRLACQGHGTARASSLSTRAPQRTDCAAASDGQQLAA